jgi:hypothetical protein
MQQSGAALALARQTGGTSTAAASVQQAAADAEADAAEKRKAELMVPAAKSEEDAKVRQAKLAALTVKSEEESGGFAPVEAAASPGPAWAAARVVVPPVAPVPSPALRLPPISPELLEGVYEVLPGPLEARGAKVASAQKAAPRSPSALFQQRQDAEEHYRQTKSQASLQAVSRLPQEAAVAEALSTASGAVLGPPTAGIRAPIPAVARPRCDGEGGSQGCGRG